MEVKAGYRQTEVGLIPSEWSVSTIGELATTSAGTTPARFMSERYFKGGHVPWVKTLDLNNSDIRETEEQVTQSALSETSLKLFPAGSVLVAMYGGYNQIGRTGLLAVPATVNQAITAIRPDPHKLSARYLLRVLNYRIEYWKAVASSSRKDPNITGRDVAEFPLAVPPTKAEQEAIAEALSDADAVIETLQQLLFKKCRIKQGATQELLNGKMRLPGFSGEWELRALGEIASANKGSQLNSSLMTEHGRFAHLNGGISPSGYTDQSNALGNTIAISEGGNSCGYVQFMSEPYWCGGHCYSVIPNRVDNRFLYHALKGEEPSIMALRVGSGLPNVQKTALLAFSLRCPVTTEEQTAISAILSDIDAELAELKAKLAKVRQLKQGMMQELLTGRIRLV